MPQGRNPSKYYINKAGGREQMFLCIGGPHDGKYLARSQVGDDYDSFNTVGLAWRDRKIGHRQIHVYRGLLYRDTYWEG